MAVFDNDITVPGTAYLRGGIEPALARSNLLQDSNQVYVIPLIAFRVWDAITTNLPSAGANDDIGLVGGTWATDSPSLQSGDLKSAGATDRYARVQIPLPIEYVGGQTVTLRFRAGMLTTVADNSATLDVVAYEPDREAGIGADLCATGATTINSVTLADKDFTITATGLNPGDMLDVRIHMAVNDAGTGTAVIAIIGSVELLCDVKG